MDGARAVRRERAVTSVAGNDDASRICAIGFAKKSIAKISLVIYRAVVPKLPRREPECAERLAGASGTAHLDHYAERLEIAFDEREHETARDILGRACRREDGTSLAELEDLRQRSEQTYLSVLRDLEADGYVRHEGSRLKFRSNLLRKWWRKWWRKYHHGRGVAP